MKLSMRQLERTGPCTACGAAVRLHYDLQNNRFVGCAGAVSVSPVDHEAARQKRVAALRNAREVALETIRAHGVSRRSYAARITRYGEWAEYPSIAAAEHAIHSHYNAAEAAGA